jgi:hypothetical protein
MQHLDNVLNRYKMMIVQDMWKNSLNHSSMSAKHEVACVLIYSNKCKMQHVNNNFNILKVNDSTHVHMLIIEKMSK